MSSPSDRSGGSAESIFSRLWLARDFSAIGEWVVFVALLAYLSIFTDSPRDIAVLVLAVALPSFLLSPVARRVISWRSAPVLGVVAQVIRAAVLLPLVQIEKSGGFEPAVLVAFLASVTSPFFAASIATQLGAIVPGARRSATRRVLHNTGLLAAMVGPVFGLILFQAAGLKGVAAAAIVAALVSGGLLLSARTSRPAEGIDPEPLVPPLEFGALPASITEAFRNPGTRQIAATQLLAALFAGGLVVVEAVFTTSGLMVGGENVAVLLAAQALGMLVAAFGYYRFGASQSLSTLVTTGLGLMGAGHFGLAMSSSLNAGAALAGVIGLGAGLLAACLGERGPEIVARDGIASSRKGLWIAVHGAAVLSIVIAGPLCESITARFTLVLSGVLLSTLAMYAFGAVPDGDTLTEADSTGRPVARIGNRSLSS